MKKGNSNQFKKGVLPMLVLQIISQERDYGYNIVDKFNAKSGEEMVLKEGTLYPILYRLEDDHCIISEWEVPEKNGKPKRYYSITDEGRVQLREQWNAWRNLKRTVQRFEEA